MWSELGCPPLESLSGAEGAVVLAVGQAASCRQSDGQSAPCSAPKLETQVHTSFWGAFPTLLLSEGAVSFDTSLGGGGCSTPN